MSFDIPAPVQVYQLPDGSFAKSQEEYLAKMYEAEAAVEAGAFIHSNPGKFGRGQDTRAFNQVVAFLSWKAAAEKLGTFEGAKQAYRQALESAAAQEAASAAPAVPAPAAA